jgi:hypothetical protein
MGAPFNSDCSGSILLYSSVLGHSEHKPSPAICKNDLGLLIRCYYLQCS